MRGKSLFLLRIKKAVYGKYTAFMRQISDILLVVVVTRMTVAAGSSFGTGQQRFHRQAVFTGFFVYFDEFYRYFVSFMDARCLHRFEAIPADFRDVE